MDRTQQGKGSEKKKRTNEVKGERQETEPRSTVRRQAPSVKTPRGERLS